VFVWVRERTISRLAPRFKRRGWLSARGGAMDAPPLDWPDMGSAQALSPVIWMPSTKYFWAAMNRIITGKVTTVEAAMSAV
jgi:hypothetical protein